jgi:diguanylate cyclase (GGDEF)-like protein/PAS domain S-box-containing protein
VRRWVNLALVASAAGVAVAQGFVPAPTQRLLGGLLLGLVILAIVSQHNALRATLDEAHSAHQEQLESERRYHAVFDAGSDVILIYELEEGGRPGQLVEVNEAACRSLGYTRAQLLVMTVDEVCAPETRRDLREQARALGGATTVVYEAQYVTSRGQRLAVEVSTRLVQIGGRHVCLAVAHSIAARKELEDFLRGLTDRDELTGLLNRRGFYTHIDRIRRWAGQTRSQVLLVYLDVDGLKRVNDEMGHAAGDALLVATGDVLRLAFREGDVLARLGGDEFVAAALLARHQDEHLDRLMIADRLESAIRAKRAELGEGYDFSLSFGSILATSDELNDMNALLARTDQRMYKAKRARRRETEQDPVRTPPAAASAAAASRHR